MGVSAARHAPGVPFWNWALETTEEQIVGFSALWRPGVPGRLDGRDARPPSNDQSDYQRAIIIL